MQLDNRLRVLRKAAGLTQTELAERSGVSQPTISQLESGVLSMNLRWTRTFARVLSCKPADLLLDADNREGLDAHERALLDRYRQADQGLRRIIERVVDALVTNEKSSDAERSA